MNDHSLPASLNFSHHQKPRVAVLVDGDNVSQASLPEIEAKARALGEPIIRRVYADMGLRKAWATETDYLATHCTTSADKNRADIHLVIGALEIAYRGLATHFLIMSDDRDFGPLVSHLREIGMQVEWAGKPKPKNKTKVVSSPKVMSDIDARLRKILTSAPNGLTLKAIGSQMRADSTVKARTGSKDWRAYFRSKPDLYSLSRTTEETVVTLKPS